jgi:hypothetical protein
MLIEFANAYILDFHFSLKDLNCRTQQPLFENETQIQTTSGDDTYILLGDVLFQFLKS